MACDLLFEAVAHEPADEHLLVFIGYPACFERLLRAATCRADGQCDPRVRRSAKELTEWHAGGGETSTL